MDGTSREPLTRREARERFRVAAARATPDILAAEPRHVIPLATLFVALTLALPPRARMDLLERTAAMTVRLVKCSGAKRRVLENRARRADGKRDLGA